MSTQKTSFIDRLKARLDRNKARPSSPEGVSDMIASVATKVSNERDLRFQQTQLLAKQLQYKADAPIRAEVEKAKTLAHRARVRRPLKSALLRNTYSDYNGRLFSDASNGMLVRLDKPHKNPLLRKLITDKFTKDAADHNLSLRTEVQLIDNAAK